MTPPKAVHVAYVHPDYTTLDGLTLGAQETPVDAFNGGLGALLDRVSRRFQDAGTLVLTAASMAKLGVPVSQPTGDDGKPAPVTAGRVLDQARIRGWKCSGLRDWTTFTRPGQPTVYLALEPWIDRQQARNPLMTWWPEDTASALALWHHVTGTPWRGTPGMAGCGILADQYPHGKRSPTWKPSSGTPDGAEEMPFHPGDFGLPMEGQRIAGLDATRMYPVAAGTALLAAVTLRPGPKVFDPALSGWWLVDIGPWGDPLLPHPAGYGAARRWVTSPTLALLDEIARGDGHHVTYTIHQSYVAPGRRLLRQWADVVERAYQVGRLVPPPGPDYDELACGRVSQAGKSVGRETLGLFNKEENWIFRPDWWFTIVALARANLWRKMRLAVAAGHRIAYIDTDCVWFLASLEYPELVPGFPLRNAKKQEDTPGTFKPKGEKEHKK